MVDGVMFCACIKLSLMFHWKILKTDTKLYTAVRFLTNSKKHPECVWQKTVFFCKYCNVQSNE